MEMIAEGQRWMSVPEPELGLGVVRGLARTKIKLWFPAADETRIYAWPGAPLVRVRFGIGERISWEEGSGLVEAVWEADDVLWYRVGEEEIRESDLSASMSRRGPLDRLAMGAEGKLDANEAFELRREALFRRARLQRSGSTDVSPRAVDAVGNPRTRLDRDAGGESGDRRVRRLHRAALHHP